MKKSSDPISLPDHVAGSGTLDRLVEHARDYARASTAENTNKAYAADWAHFSRWCRMKGIDPLPASAQVVGLYLTDLAAPGDGSPGLSVSTIERRLSGLVWTYAQRGMVLDRKDAHIATILAGIRRKHARPPAQKEAILTLNAKTGWREVEIGRGSSEQTCPVHALSQWLQFAKIDFGPVFVRTSRDGKRALPDRLSDKHVARLIKQTVLKSGIRTDLTEKDRLALFSGHSLRAGLASSAEVDERYVQKQLGHASAEMTRRYQRRRDRFRVNLTKAAGL
ncbi:tyrosine-type recombinase/integrase [Halovulum sp. GXIMD14793]